MSPIDYNSIDFSAIQFQGVPTTFNITGLVVFPLSDRQTLMSLNARSIQVNLMDTDVEQLKASRYFVDRNTTFIAIFANAVSDIAFFQNSIVERNETNALQVRNFVGDMDGPILFSFLLNYINNQLLLMFNQPVLVTSFNFTQISFSSMAMPGMGDETYYLTGGEIVNIDPNFIGLMDVIIALNEQDATNLKSSLTLATDVNNTFISLTNDTVSNTFGERNMPIFRLRAANIVSDPTIPRLELSSFTLDMNIGVIRLSFSDVVRSSTFNPMAIVLQPSAFSNEEERFQLSFDSTSMSPDGFFLLVNLSAADLNTLKSFPGLATDINSTYLTIRASAIEDVFETDIIAITNGAAIQANDYQEDVIPPMLYNFTLDLNDGQITMTFSESVNISTLQIGNIFLQSESNRTSADVWYVSSNNTIVEITSPTEVRLTLTLDNLNELKQLINVGTNVNNTYIVISENGVFDFAENGYNDSMPLMAAMVIPDILPPELLRFDLNLNNGMLILSFCETVNASSIDIQSFSFQEA